MATKQGISTAKGFQNEVPFAEYATTSGYAADANSAEFATSANEANFAQNAGNATRAETADSATRAETADSAVWADGASNAETVNNIKIEQDENGVLKIGDIVIPQKRRVCNNVTSDNATVATGVIAITDREEKTLNGKTVELFFELVLKNTVTSIDYEGVVSGEIKFDIVCSAQLTKRICVGTYFLRALSNTNQDSNFPVNFFVNVYFKLLSATSFQLMYECVNAEGEVPSTVSGIYSGVSAKFSASKIFEVIE